RLELVLGHGPGLDRRENLFQLRQTGRRLGIAGIGLPPRLADDMADRLPHRGLDNEVDIGVGIGLPALAFQDPTRLAAARCVAGTRHGIAERAIRVLRIFGQRPVRQALLVAQLDAAEVEYAVLHGDRDLLAEPGGVALEQRADDAKREVHAGAGIADLRAGHQRRAVVE